MRSQSRPSSSTSVIKSIKRRLKNTSKRRSSSITREVCRRRFTTYDQTDLAKFHQSPRFTHAWLADSPVSPLSICYSEKGSTLALLWSAGDRDRGHCSQGACGCPGRESHWYSWLCGDKEAEVRKAATKVGHGKHIKLSLQKLNLLSIYSFHHPAWYLLLV